MVLFPKLGMDSSPFNRGVPVGAFDLLLGRPVPEDESAEEFPARKKCDNEAILLFTFNKLSMERTH
jgi:hypothetical protein